MQRLDVVVLEQRGRLRSGPHRPLSLCGVTLKHRRDRTRLRRVPAVRNAQQVTLDLLLTDRRPPVPGKAVDQRLDIVDTDGLEDPRDPSCVVRRQSEQHVLAARSQHTALGRHVYRPLKRGVGRGRTGHPPQHQLVADATLADDQRKHITAGDPSPLEQRANPPVTREGQQHVLGLDRGPTEHAGLILAQQDHVIRLISERSQHDPILPHEHRRIGGKLASFPAQPAHPADGRTTPLSGARTAARGLPELDHSSSPTTVCSGEG